jgi:hypothetical protein
MIAVGIAVRAVGEGNAAPVAGAAPPAAGGGGEDLVMVGVRRVAIGSGQLMMLGQVHVA